MTDPSSRAERSDDQPAPKVRSEQELAALERTADQAMIAALEAIEATRADLAQQAAVAQRTQAPADRSRLRRSRIG